MSSSTLRIPTARVFKPLLSRARYKGAFGGRASGKSHFYAGNVVRRAYEEPGLRIVCIREVQKTLKESAMALIEDKLNKFGLGPEFNVLSSEIKTPGGGVVIFQGMQDHTAESIKSLEDFDVAWVEEGQTLSGRSLELLRPTIRSSGSELWFGWNPRSAKDPVDRLFRGGALPPDAVVVRANYTDNPFLPAEMVAEIEYDRKENPGRFAHIWLGEYEPMAMGAIWDRVTLHEGRRASFPDLGRIVVSVDPAVSSEQGANEHGIIVTARGEDDRGYVLEDGTTTGPPHKWAARAVALFDKWEADAIVIEINQGGDMVRHTLQSIRPSLPIVEVRASRGKHVRAEPIASLYHLGRISHVGTFNELEDQMCQMTAAGFEGEGSPDRVDALVWGMTELFPSLVRRKTETEYIDPVGGVEGGWMA